MIGLLASGLGRLKAVLIAITAIVVGAAFANRTPLNDWAIETLAYGWLVIAIWALGVVATLRHTSMSMADRSKGVIALTLTAIGFICGLGSPEGTGFPPFPTNQAGEWGAALAGSSPALQTLKISLLGLLSLILLIGVFRRMYWLRP